MIEVITHLHKGDGTVAALRSVAFAVFLEIHPEGVESVIAIDVPPELAADAKAFAESINQLCRRRSGVVA